VPVSSCGHSDGSGPSYGALAGDQPRRRPSAATTCRQPGAPAHIHSAGRPDFGGRTGM